MGGIAFEVDAVGLEVAVEVDVVEGIEEVEGVSPETGVVEQEKEERFDNDFGIRIPLGLAGDSGGEGVLFPVRRAVAAGEGSVVVELALLDALVK